MTLPEWNSEWEKPDPLRGKRGWCLHHYASVGIVVILLVAAFGFLLPTVRTERNRVPELTRMYEEFREAIDQTSGDPLEVGSAAR